MEWARDLLRRTPNRTFVLYPAVVLGTKLIGGHGRAALSWGFAPLLAWGYLEYRLCGLYRRRLGRGGPGIDLPPEDLVTSGPYAVVRNPMYLGHIIFLVGLALFARSWFGAVIAAGTAWWFNQRVKEDERRLRDQFGQRYVEYQARVPRWIPRIFS
ncbi:MAG TPA: isoprenylcysteine carboxylmethyltransferase family protein [Chloroflexota bacterium]|nr:isoprenylcysteine carboxylmethyltransferase family protein [Chloroflexota bacterium]